MLGVKPIQEALILARERGLDLVEIAPQAKPPVCKVLDYSKYLYEQEKKQRDARKHQHASLLKELRIKPRIASHDLETKVKHMEEFIHKGDKVRLTVVFHGRENQHRDLGRTLLQQIQARFTPIAVTEGGFQMMGNRMSITLIPRPATAQHAQPQQQPAAPAPAANTSKPGL
jgi:translation initiation factor IF-3